MEHLDEHLNRLSELQRELEQPGRMGPSLLQRLGSAVEGLKGAAEQHLEQVKAEAATVAARMHEQAEKLRRQAEQPPEPPHPPELADGISEVEIDGLVKKLLELARPGR